MRFEVNSKAQAAVFIALIVSVTVVLLFGAEDVRNQVLIAIGLGAAGVSPFLGPLLRRKPKPEDDAEAPPVPSPEVPDEPDP